MSDPDTFGGIEHPKKKAFLLAFCETGSISESAKAADCSRNIHYFWMREDEVYRTAFAEAEHQFADNLEAEARSRAIKGSDTLMIFLLKGAKPEKYADRSKMTLGGDKESPLKIVWGEPDQDA